MPHAVSLPSPGLQALILCGPGSSFPTFTANPDESPKALLPIANRPMVWYPIDFCYRAGITNITLICPPASEKALTTGLNTNVFLTGLPLPRPDILAPKDLDYNMGTAEILRLPEIRELVSSDFVVLPCDLVCELGGDLFLQAWQAKSASLADAISSTRLGDVYQAQHSGGLGVWYDTKANTPIKKEETDFIATAPLPSPSTAPPKDSLFSDLSTLVSSMPTDSLKDVTEERNGVPMRHGLLRANPRVRLLTTHRDAHIYIFPHWILDFVRQNDRMESISEDVVGWWAKAGWQAGLAEKLHIKEICCPKQPEMESNNSPTSETSPDAPDDSDRPSAGFRRPSVALAMGLNRRKYQDLYERKEHKESEIPPILAYTHSGSKQTPGSLIRRVDTAQLLLAISLQLAKVPSLEENEGDSASPYAHSKKIAYPDGVKSRTTITKADCLIGDNVTIEEKVSIKESVVGTGCQISEGVKLSGCLLMDGVKVGKNCKLTKCILGKRCVIGDNTVLTDCEVQENLLVEPRTEDKDNKLMSSEGLEATEAEMEEVLQEQEEANMDEDVAME